MGAIGILSRIVRTIAGVIAGILGLGIALVLLKANEENGIVSTILDVARFFGKPFRDMFTLEDQRGEIAVNWGIAALVYLIAGALIVAVLAAIGRSIGSRGDKKRAGRDDD